MNQAIVNLRKRFKWPSAEQLQRHPRCGICWNDYDGKDQPVTLPCGHVFGEECIIAWARGTTSAGRHNGCPSCRAELLPPSVTSALRYRLPRIWIVFEYSCGGSRGVALFVGLTIVTFGAQLVSGSKTSLYIQFSSAGCWIMFVVIGTARLVGWRWALLYTAAAIVTGNLIW